jgi:hypothetical protein
MKFILKALNRFKEPSTYAGLSTAAVLFGVSTEQMNEWTLAAAGIFAFLAVVLGEVHKA